MKRGVQINVTRKDEFEGLQRALSYLTDQEILVGVPEDSQERKEDNAPGNADLAYIHDTGSPAANIPPRPFMEPGIQEGKPEILKRMKAVAQAALSGSSSGVQKGLHAVGLVAATAIKNKINNGPFQPLAESTLWARRARGRTGTRPLIDTGQLRNAITYVLRKVK